MALIIIQGKTATGKTRIARQLAKDLRLGLCVKDDYKERQYDALGKVPNLKKWADIEQQSWRELYKAVEAAVRANQPLIVEGNFLAKQRKQLRQIVPADYDVLEVFCLADLRTIMQRYVVRNRSGERHRGHRDHLWYGIVWLELLAARAGYHWVKPVRLSDKLLLVDTTDFTKVDYEQIKKFVTS